MDIPQRFIVKVAIVALDDDDNEKEEIGTYRSALASTDERNLWRVALELAERADEAMGEEIAEGDLFEYDAPDPVHG